MIWTVYHTSFLVRVSSYHRIFAAKIWRKLRRNKKQTVKAHCDISNRYTVIVTIEFDTFQERSERHTSNNE